MMQIPDLRNALVAAPVYRRFQQLVTGNHYARFVNEYLRPEAGQRILDIGCGPADILPYLLDVEYVGVDLSPQYIASAHRRFGNRGQFHCRGVCETSIGDLGAFDLVLGHGIVHHLDDAEALHLFQHVWTWRTSYTQKFLQNIRIKIAHMNYVIFLNVKFLEKHELLLSCQFRSMKKSMSGVTIT